MVVALFGLFLLAAGGTLGTLVALGTVPLEKLAFWRSPPPKEPTIPAGYVAVPISAKPIAAYVKVTRDHLFNTKTGRFASVYLPPDQITPEMKVRMNDVMGRVLDHDKPAGYVFTEKDFLPPGTREGWTAGIPPGKRAFRLDAGRIAGVHGLRAGDRIDIVASVPLDKPRHGRTEPWASQPAKQAEVRVLVQDGVIVAPVAARAMPTTTSSLTQGTRTSTRPVEEILIAVAPEEVSRLSEAETLEYGLTAVAHSGHPDDQAFAAERVADPPAPPRPRAIETIVGSKRHTVFFPPDGGSPVTWEAKR